MFYFAQTFVGNEHIFMVPESYRCACSGTVLTFNCTTVGLGTTLWGGTAFNCENRGNQIILLNGQFLSGDTGSSGVCGDNIVAEGIKVEGNCHTSQLDITVTSSEINQTTIVCTYSSSQGLSTVGRGVITVLSGKEPRVHTIHDKSLTITIIRTLGLFMYTAHVDHYPPPNGLTVTDVSSEKISFTWNSTAPVCSSSIHYLITASNCGVCPQTVTNTSATCTNLQPSTEVRECRFSVQIVVCRVMGNASGAISERIGGMSKSTVMLSSKRIVIMVIMVSIIKCQLYLNWLLYLVT